MDGTIVPLVWFKKHGLMGTSHKSDTRQILLIHQLKALIDLKLVDATNGANIEGLIYTFW